MCPALRFPLSADLLWRLPRHPDWRYERVDGEAWLSPRPRLLWFVRPAAAPVCVAPSVCAEIGTIQQRDRSAVVELLVEVWSDQDPYRSIADGERRLRAEAEHSLDILGLGVSAVDAHGVCGAAMLVPSGAGGQTRAWLTVRRNARDRGLATAMLGVVVESLSREGVQTLTSATSAVNVPSLRWHLSSGFQLADDPLRTAG